LAAFAITSLLSAFRASAIINPVINNQPTKFACFAAGDDLSAIFWTCGLVSPSEVFSP
jgi:hypothetical protein